MKRAFLALALCSCSVETAEPISQATAEDQASSSAVPDLPVIALVTHYPARNVTVATTAGGAFSISVDCHPGDHAISGVCSGDGIVSTSQATAAGWLCGGTCAAGDKIQVDAVCEHVGP